MRSTIRKSGGCGGAGRRGPGAVCLTTAGRRGRWRLDPRLRSHDWNALNNTEKRGMWGRGDVGILRLDNPTRETVRRDKLVTAILPVAWFNDYGGLTVGLRTRQKYLGRFEQNIGLGSVTRGGGAKRPGGD